jgi:hypothetical protein
MTLEDRLNERERSQIERSKREDKALKPAFYSGANTVTPLGSSMPLPTENLSNAGSKIGDPVLLRTINSGYIRIDSPVRIEEPKKPTVAPAPSRQMAVLFKVFNSDSGDDDYYIGGDRVTPLLIASLDPPAGGGASGEQSVTVSGNIIFTYGTDSSLISTAWPAPYSSYISYGSNPLPVIDKFDFLGSVNVFTGQQVFFTQSVSAAVTITSGPGGELNLTTGAFMYVASAPIPSGFPVPIAVAVEAQSPPESPPSDSASDSESGTFTMTTDNTINFYGQAVITASAPDPTTVDVVSNAEVILNFGSGSVTATAYLSRHKKQNYIAIKSDNELQYFVIKGSEKTTQVAIDPALPTPDPNDWRSSLVTWTDPPPATANPCVNNYRTNTISNIYRDYAYLAQNNLATIQAALVGKVGQRVKQTVIPYELVSGSSCVATAKTEFSVGVYGIPANAEVLAVAAIQVPA